MAEETNLGHAYFIIDLATRSLLPAALEQLATELASEENQASGLRGHAAALRALGEIKDQQSATAASDSLRALDLARAGALELDLAIVRAINLADALAAADPNSITLAGALDRSIASTMHIDQLGLGELCASDGESTIWPRSGRQPRRDPKPG